MRICLLGSGSGGNSTYIESRGAALLIDQGFSFREIQKRLESRELDPSAIMGILVTHEHVDHISGVGITARKLNVPVYGTPGTLNGKKNIFNGNEQLIPIESGEPFTISPFEILPFRVSHDSVDPVQFCVQAGRKKIAMATDLGFVSTLVEQVIKDSDLVVIEANHDVEMLKKGTYPWYLKQRIMSKTGHLSNRNAAETIFNITLSRKKKPKIVLAHLSEENNCPELAEKEVKEVFERFDCSLKHLLIAPQDEATPVLRV